MSTSTVAPPPPPPSSILFARGVIARLATWSTLRLAVQENWGGPGASEKRTWLAGVIVDTFEEQTQTPDEEYIEDLLLQVMEDEFEVGVEDGSAESVAKDIVRIWDEIRIGKQTLVLKFEEISDSLKGKKAVAQEGITSDDDDDDSGEEDSEEGENDENKMEVEDEPPQLVDRRTPRNQPEIDEDGFTLVKGKSKARK